MEDTMKETLKLWHKFITSGAREILDEILHEDVTFHSPVVHTPQKGKHITSKYLMGASMVLSSQFKYTRKVINGTMAVLEFQCVVDDIIVEGIDIIEFELSTGKIVDFKVFIRPLQAINIVHQKMAEMLTK